MLNLESDYTGGMASAILEAFTRTNDEISKTYGFDRWSESAKGKIREACACPEAEIFFLTGGTQTNMVVIDSVLAGYEGVIAVDSGHINVHESGAVEFTGHKVIALPSHEGLMDPDELEGWLSANAADPNREHCVLPGMVYITFPSELGTLYKPSAIARIHDICGRYGLHLYIDGARLGYGLAAYEALSKEDPSAGKVTLPWLAAHCDVLYIGGTKQGAMCGEAVVFPKSDAPGHFFSSVKQHGALLAKGRLTGIQFDALFTDGLYLRLSGNAIATAIRFKELMKAHGLVPYIDSPTNQQFFIIPDDLLPELREKIVFEEWGPYKGEKMAAGVPATICRFVTCWNTSMNDIEEFFRSFNPAKK